MTRPGFIGKEPEYVGPDVLFRMTWGCDECKQKHSLVTAGMNVAHNTVVLLATGVKQLLVEEAVFAIECDLDEGEKSARQTGHVPEGWVK